MLLLHQLPTVKCPISSFDGLLTNAYAHESFLEPTTLTRSMHKGSFDGERQTNGGSSIGRSVRTSLSLFSRRESPKRVEEINMKQHNEK